LCFPLSEAGAPFTAEGVTVASAAAGGDFDLFLDFFFRRAGVGVSGLTAAAAGSTASDGDCSVSAYFGDFFFFM